MWAYQPLPASSRRPSVAEMIAQVLPRVLGGWAYCSHRFLFCLNLLVMAFVGPECPHPLLQTSETLPWNFFCIHLSWVHLIEILSTISILVTTLRASGTFQKWGCREMGEGQIWSVAMRSQKERPPLVPLDIKEQNTGMMQKAHLTLLGESTSMSVKTGKWEQTRRMLRNSITFPSKSFVWCGK